MSAIFPPASEVFLIDADLLTRPSSTHQRQNAPTDPEPKISLGKALLVCFVHTHLQKGDHLHHCFPHVEAHTGQIVLTFCLFLPFFAASAETSLP